MPGRTIYYTTDGSTPTNGLEDIWQSICHSRHDYHQRHRRGVDAAASMIASATYTEKPWQSCQCRRENNVYAFDGDSLTVGWAGSYPILPWTEDVVVPAGFTKSNVAHGGFQISDMDEAGDRVGPSA